MAVCKNTFDEPLDVVVVVRFCVSFFSSFASGFVVSSGLIFRNVLVALVQID